MIFLLRKYSISKQHNNDSTVYALTWMRFAQNERKKKHPKRKEKEKAKREKKEDIVHCWVIASYRSLSFNIHLWANETIFNILEHLFRCFNFFHPPFVPADLVLCAIFRFSTQNNILNSQTDSSGFGVYGRLGIWQQRT